ncbi:Sec-independent protein translocase protein TatB [Bordetella genomosp. 12]|uniref:Sec-independent protein translocase protein TatB n=1 Tax=Bordetella genomosp. 12 TaxID=463035 RepID=A0A261VSQ5_9BORD|nr:Sec-independent protein translocase protein TatB [Bordetella genomosp. 12]OZI77138.1 twin-arginine translocase subunit TatB [Bordetella genomosp. 12]
MFDVSFTELVVIGVVALIVLGPERLPKVARTVGHLLGRAQRYVNDVKSDIQREIELDELRKFKQEMDSTAQDVNLSLKQATDSIRSAGDTLRAELDNTTRAVNEAAADAERSIAPPAPAPLSQTEAAPAPAITPPAPSTATPSVTPAAAPAVAPGVAPAAESADDAPATPPAASKTPPTGNAT